MIAGQRAGRHTGLDLISSLVGASDCIEWLRRRFTGTAIENRLTGLVWSRTRDRDDDAFKVNALGNFHDRIALEVDAESCRRTIGLKINSVDTGTLTGGRTQAFTDTCGLPVARRTLNWVNLDAQFIGRGLRKMIEILNFGIEGNPNDGAVVSFKNTDAG
ncbi:MAG: hypothetical protein ABL901_00115 [Hyphomicrobiaceae bacterium]